jgi:hypothetical protein
MRTLAILAVLALAVGGQIGCVTSNSVTDGDRQILHQGLGALEGAVMDLQGAQGKVSKGSEAWTMIGLGLAKLEDLERGAAHLQEVHGPPKEPKPYSTENMTAAIAQSTQEHAGTPWGTIAVGAVSVAAGIAGTMLGMPWLSSLFPALAGKWKAAADTGVQIVTALRRKAEEPGGLHAKDLLTIAREYSGTAPKGVDAYMKAEATATEKKIGFTPTVKLEEPTTMTLAATTPPVPGT